MSRSDVSPRGSRAATTAGRPLTLEQARAALVEHYPQLVRVGYLVLPRTASRHRRVLAAHALVQRALPRGRPSQRLTPAPAPTPRQRPGEDPGYTYLRLRVLVAALDACRPVRLGRREVGWLRRPPRLLPQVMGLRLLPRMRECDELAVDQEVSALPPAGRAAYALRRIDGLGESVTGDVLAAAGVAEQQIRAALRSAEAVSASCRSGCRAELPDPCVLQASPPDVLRRRQQGRTAAFAGAAVALAVGTLAFLPDGAGDGSPVTNPAVAAALDPQGLRRVSESLWQRAARVDFSVWPARGAAVADEELLRRALAEWVAPGAGTAVTATPGTQTGPPPGPAQLLYAGPAGGTQAVLLYDGLRLVRYAEPAGAAQDGSVTLDFARVDGADTAASSAVLLDREEAGARYLAAPWVTEVAVVDLADAQAAPRSLAVGEEGVTAAVPLPGSPAARGGNNGVPGGECRDVPALRLFAAGQQEPHTLADLGELAPAVLSYGPPGERRAGGGMTGEDARERWAHTACHLSAVAAGGVRSVNAWEFAEQPLPGAAGTARWLCTRAETWRGVGGTALAQLLAPAAGPGGAGSVVALAEDTRACGELEPRVLAGALWQSPDRKWYLLAAGSEEVASITADGGVEGTAQGRTLVLPARQGARAAVTARLAHGGELPALGNRDA